MKKDWQEVFFAAQDAAEGGRSAEAAALHEALIEGVGLLPPFHWPQARRTAVPPAALLRSASLNALGELAMDRAIAGGFPYARGSGAAEAREFFEKALEAWPQNAQANDESPPLLSVPPSHTQSLLPSLILSFFVLGDHVPGVALERFGVPQALARSFRASVLGRAPSGALRSREGSSR